VRFLGYTLLLLGFMGTLYHGLDTRKTKGLVMSKNLQQLQIGQTYSSDDVTKSVRGTVDDMVKDSDWYLTCATGMLIGGILAGIGASHRKAANPGN
jgi:hypothetical protein